MFAVVRAEEQYTYSGGCFVTKLIQIGYLKVPVQIDGYFFFSDLRPEEQTNYQSIKQKFSIII